MKYTEFYDRFGGSYRRKHLKKKIHSFATLRKHLKGVLNGINKREYTIPDSSELPKDFIRLEPWEGEYLFYLAYHAKKGIVETGRFHGGSTFVMACANGEVPIHSIDIEPQNDKFLKEQFARFSIGKNADLIVGDSQKTRYPQIRSFDMLFIDGDHSYQGCTNDLENWFPELASGGHVVLHDCYHGSEVKESVIDFINKYRAQVQVMVSPYKNREHWFCPEGSFAHFIKL
ncbi:MAG: class I SAM-dependent methyltransferase [Alphaproteobacteria bacterium]|nr:class I SAM-dependent methyltransferase [Alphaproteobacteria bacterium]